MSDLDRVSEGRFLELEEDKRVMAGEGGGKRRRVGGGGSGAGSGAGAGDAAGEEGGLSGFNGATTGFTGVEAGVVLKRRRCEAAGRRGSWECSGAG